MTTKEKILRTALELFSTKGFESTGVDEIAEAIGIKGPSIYKHFKGKQDIYDSIIDTFEKYYAEYFTRTSNNREIPDSVWDLKKMTLGQVSATMNDPFIISMRKMLSKEQFKTPAIANLATKHIVDGIEELYTQLFQGMMDKGLLKEDDAEMLAIQYVSPITMYIHMVDREPGKQAMAMERIERHINHFIRVYGSDLI